MVCLGLEPGAAGWKAQTNPLSYSGTPKPWSLAEILLRQVARCYLHPPLPCILGVANGE